MTLRCLALLLAFVGCHGNALDPSQTDFAVSPCERSGGSCVERSAGQDYACADDQFDVQGTPQLCGAPTQDCCVARCPELAPALGSECRIGSQCSYSTDASCQQHVCFEGAWVVLVSDCSS